LKKNLGNRGKVGYVTVHNPVLRFYKKEEYIMDTEKYKDKRFSVLGDSISTLQGYSEPKNAEFYDALRMRKAGLHGVEDTWWGQVIARLGGKLLVNNSISGSTVCRRPTHTIPSYACSDERTSALHTEKGTNCIYRVF
jgi:hypothetical protein